jgi:hypothetical protein
MNGFTTKNTVAKNLKSPLNLRANQHLHCFSPPLILILHPPLLEAYYLKVLQFLDATASLSGASHPYIIPHHIDNDTYLLY